MLSGVQGQFAVLCNLIHHPSPILLLAQAPLPRELTDSLYNESTPDTDISELEGIMKLASGYTSQAGSPPAISDASHVADTYSFHGPPCSHGLTPSEIHPDMVLTYSFSTEQRKRDCLLPFPSGSLPLNFSLTFSLPLALTLIADIIMSILGSFLNKSLCSLYQMTVRKYIRIGGRGTRHLCPRGSWVTFERPTVWSHKKIRRGQEVGMRQRERRPALDSN